MNPDEVYEKIDRELHGGDLVRSLWTRIYGEVDGDEAKAKARYIKARFAQLMGDDYYSNKTTQNEEILHSAEESRAYSHCLAVPPRFGYVGIFSDGVAAFSYSEEGDKGYINSFGGVVISPQYSEARPFINGVAVVSIGEDKSVKLSSGEWKYAQNKKFGIVDKNGKYIVYPEYNNVEVVEKNIYLSNGVNRADKEYVYSIENRRLEQIHKTGMSGYFFGSSKIFPRKFHDWDRRGFWDNAKIGKMGYVDRSGKWVIKPKFSDAWRFSENLFDGQRAIFRSEGDCNKCGLIDQGGNIVCPAMYDEIIYPAHECDSFLQYCPNYSTSYGIALVKSAADDVGRWRHINKDGRPIYDKEFSGLYFFTKDGLASAGVGGGDSYRWGIIDLTGSYIIQPLYEKCMPLTKNLFSVQQAGKWGIIDRQSKWILEPNIFGEIDNFCSEHKVAVFKGTVDRSNKYNPRYNGKWGVIDLCALQNA